MLKLIAPPALVLPALALAFMATPVLAQSQPQTQAPTITITAPAQMDEVRITDEQSEVARAQARVADAQAKLREEQRELERANNRLAERREELASVESRMVAMGGARPTVALNTP